MADSSGRGVPVWRQVYTPLATLQAPVGPFVDSFLIWRLTTVVAQQRIVIDGYNLIHAVPELARLLERDAEHARDRLVTLLADFRATRKVSVTVVFDGQGFSGLHARPTGGVEVAFSRPPQNADARIKAMLAKEKSPRACTVVTSDNSIALHVRDFGAKVVRSEDFARQLHGSHKPQATSPKQPSDKPMTAAEVAEWEEYFRKGRQDRGGKQ